MWYCKYQQEVHAKVCSSWPNPQNVLSFDLKACTQDITITQHFPEYFKGEEEEEEENGNVLDEPNIEDDETIDNYLQSTFDKSTGLWQYKSLTHGHDG